MDSTDVTEPPADAPPPAEAPPARSALGARNTRNTRIGAAIVIGVLVAVFGYAAAGFALATSRIDGARNTYNAVVAHQNDITDTVNLFNTKFTTTNAAATASDLKADRSLLDEVVSKSKAAETTSATDDALLATAQASLTDSSWLTAFNRSNLDHYTSKLGHERKALRDSKTLTGDYVLLATFYQSFFDALIDFDTVGSKIQASDFQGALASISTLQTDLGKALQSSSAPGLPPEVHQFIVDFQTFATDEGKLLAAVNSSDVSAGQSLSPKVTADVTKLDSYDFTKIGTDIASYYTPLIDDYNAEISKANSM